MQGFDDCVNDGTVVAVFGPQDPSVIDANDTALPKAQAYQLRHRRCPFKPTVAHPTEPDTLKSQDNTELRNKERKREYTPFSLDSKLRFVGTFAVCA